MNPNLKRDRPRHDKLDITIAKVFPGEMEEEKLEKAKKLDIASITRIWKIQSGERASYFRGFL